MRILAIVSLFACLALETRGQINQARRQYPARYVPEIPARILPRLFVCDDKKIAQNVIAWQWRTIAAQGSQIRDLSQSFDNLARSTKKLVIFKNPIADVATKIALGIFLTWGVNQL
jgi:hypothetical protein